MSIEERQVVSGFYTDPEKLTYDEAKRLVERYLRDDVERSVTRVDHVLKSEDYRRDNHNRIRVRKALQKKCEPHHPERSGPTRFKIPEEYRA